MNENDKLKIESAGVRVQARKIEPVRRGFRPLDFFVLLIGLSGVIFFIILFRHDLFRTIYLQNVKPVGTVVVRSNVVQRRLADRVLWDRLSNDSSLYMGDIIRVADLSSASLDIEGNQLFLNENTLIRIQRSADGESLKIELSEGGFNVSTNDDGNNLQLNLMGQLIEASSGSVVNVAAVNNNIVLQVNEGRASLVNNTGENRDVNSGSILVLDNEGTELHEPAVVVTRPHSNARLLKNSREPLPVNFVWNRVNFNDNEYLRIDIAEDRNFDRITQTIERLTDSAHPQLNSGTWFWRITFHETVLASGRLNIIDAAGPELVSPIKDSSIRFQSDLPSVRFQWVEVRDASHYFLEVSLLSDFINTQITQETSATSFIAPEMGRGTWYWRVLPVFAAGFEGTPSFSEVSSFRIEQNTSAQEEIILPPPPPVPLELRLISPEGGTNIPGLAARSSTTFRWDSDRNVRSSRFVLSQNSDPLANPTIEINNPGRTVQVNSINPGTWYWTVEAVSIEGLTSSAPPQQIRVLPIPQLPPPVLVQPANGYHIDMETIVARRAIDFSWQPVTGANAYIITLFDNNHRQIFRSTPLNNTRWTLEDFNFISGGIVYWHVSALNVRQNGEIDQTGTPSERNFIVEFPLPEVQARRPGILYGQ